MLQPFQTAEQKRIQSDYYVEGYAATYEPYLLFETEAGPIYEQFTREAFHGCDMSDVIMQYDHQGKVFARQSNRTLIVEPDENGLFMCADLSKSAGAKDLFEEISAGLITKMSWGFQPGDPGDYCFDERSRTLIHNRIKKIYDVSAVSIPANQDTEIYVRSFTDGEIGRALQELQARREAKMKLILKLKLEGVSEQ